VALDVGLAHPGDAQGECHVIHGGQVLDQAEILEHHPDAAAHGRVVRALEDRDVAAEQLDPAGRRAQAEVDQLEQRGFAGAARAHEEVERARRQCEGDAAQHFRPSGIADGDAVETNSLFGP
jgi:hypothetical protein